MKKLLILFSVFLILGVSLPAAALHLPPFQVIVDSETYDVINQISDGIDYYYYNSGDYIGTVLEANDSLAVVDAVLDKYFDTDIILTFYAKVEEGEDSWEGPGPLYIDYADETEVKPGEYEYRSGT